MKTEIHELTADLKAAVRIGNPESIQVALGGYRALPEVAGNAALSEAFIDQAILPLGEILAHPRLMQDDIEMLLDDPLTGVRALGAGASGVRFLAAQDISGVDLRRPGKDPRAAVRIALGEALARNTHLAPQRLLDLVHDWLGIDSGGPRSAQTGSPRLRHSGLLALRGLIPDHTEAAAALLLELPPESDHEARTAHVETLVSLAENGGAQAVYEILAAWSAEAQPDTWMITKTLSAAWAADDLAESEAILRTLEAQSSDDRAIDRTRRALARQSSD